MAILKSKAAKAAATTLAAAETSVNTANSGTASVSTLPVVPRTATADWSIADLSAIYTEYRTSLVSQARRMLRVDADANEVVQEAFLKFMLAAPDLDTTERAVAYLRASVNNLSLNVIRARGDRPNLVALDAETTQERLNEIANENHVDIDTTITAAEDAAIIREALSRLTSDQRTALVMWEMEGRSTEEIATALNTTPANVRHIVTRARQSMVRVLSEWVVDETTGATALDSLSNTYKKAAELAQKSSKAALSLVLVLTAFLGFNSMTGREGAIAPLTTLTTQQEVIAPVAPITDAPAVVVSPSASTAANAAANSLESAAKKSFGMVAGVDIKTGKLNFAGLDKDGIPTGFTVTDASKVIGKLSFNKTALPTMTENGMIVSVPAITANASTGPNVLLAQTIKVDGTGTTYEVSPSVGIAGNWAPLLLSSTNTVFDRLTNGNYLMTSTMTVDSTIAIDFVIPTGARGSDLTSAPKTIITRILLNPAKSQILAQAIFISEPITKAAK
jgi:RNA polymerase sigma factor (sigma-70 family)